MMQLARGKFGLVEFGEHAPALLVESPPRSGDAHASRGTVEKPLLELQHILAGGGAREAETLGGAREAAGLNDGRKNASVFTAVNTGTKDCQWTIDNLFSANPDQIERSR